ncbi:hypothetical protein LEL_01769 [Akanthomyces lecanii RCEF 1005]|uniref:Noranthrone monooxygenase n=1 Tax=Akanthomyces lecanii RCEF 1005 TaxID=1081108 RepID=A0A169YJ52_CORDF|nr:hypothetical protein LEL_01769 [Akanthomyces lecanii RCEF 1005]
MQLTGPSLVAVATGIVGSAWASGAIASITFIGTSAAIDVPETTARTWRELFRRGANLMPKVAAAVTLAYGYAAYDAHRAGGVWGGYAAAAGFVISIVPFTVLVMRYTNTCLHKMAEGRDETKTWNLRALLQRWNLLNLTRSCLCLISSVLGMVTMVQNIS